MGNMKLAILEEVHREGHRRYGSIEFIEIHAEGGEERG
jgi:hypothetical protein